MTPPLRTLELQRLPVVVRQRVRPVLSHGICRAVVPRCINTTATWAASFFLAVVYTGSNDAKNAGQSNQRLAAVSRSYFEMAENSQLVLLCFAG